MPSARYSAGSKSKAMILAEVGALAILGGALLVVAGERGRSGAAQDGGGAGGSDPHGRQAAVPEAIPVTGLRDVAFRVVREVSADRAMLIAAGVTFYLLLALFPSLAALVALYGLIADPSTIAEHLRALAGFLPPGAYDLIAGQIETLVKAHNGSLGLAFVIGFAIALWSAHSGTLSVFDAMNVAYGETEKRSFVRLNVIALCFTFLAMLAAVTLLCLVAVMPVVFSYLWLDQWKESLILLARWPLLLLGAFAASAAIYRFGPSREPAKFRWLTWGAALATIGWLIMSIAFSLYLTHFANYNATYGTLGALVGLLMWMWLSVLILIVGAELNAELERQTERDTTTGPARPIGTRGAYVADSVGEAES